jgi:PTH1 family peptidyl-tRNA hydrolase
MKIIVGLGNPGPKYETTRHNVGFLAVDRMVECWNARGPNNVPQGEAYEATVQGEKVLLLKPLTYMNNSGRCLAPIFKFYKCTPADLIVIHDDLDLKPITMRLKTGGGTGGHNGLKSIDANLGAGLTFYHRIRLGIGRPAPAGPNSGSISPADYVLQPFTDEELRKLDPLLDDAARAAEMIIDGAVNNAMNEYNRER